MACKPACIVIIPTKPSISAPFQRWHQIKFPTATLKSTIVKCLIRNQSPPKPADGKDPSRIPARDRVMEFGKYKGRMLGSLPSTYLKWISNNLRAGDTEEWAVLADEVLEDTVYRERLEWELAEKVLTGSGLRANSTDGRNAAAQLSEICDRFGWDEGDKEGWSRIDFSLLGTSLGGRIPRRKEGNDNVERKGSKKLGGDEDGEDGEDCGVKRRERRQRARRRRMENAEERTVVGDHGLEGVERAVTAERVDAAARRRPFPGREAFLKKVMNGEGLP